MNKIAYTLTLAALCACTSYAQMGKKTIGIPKVKMTAALQAQARVNPSVRNAIGVTEGLDGSLIAAIAASRKFTVVERSDRMADLAEEVELAGNGDGAGGLVAKKAAEFGQLTGAETLLMVTVDQYSESSTSLLMNGVSTRKTRLVASAQMRIVDSSTGEILDASNVQVDLTDMADSVVLNGQIEEKNNMAMLLPQVSRQLAEKSVARLVQILYPAKILDVDGTTITINRGEGSFKVGDIVQTFGKTKTIVDPDTGESFTIKGKAGARARITSVEPNYSQAEIIDGQTATFGAIVTLVQ